MPKATASKSSPLVAGSPVPAGRRRVSMRDVARAVGVSVSAVSLALKNSARVSPAVREKIQAKIQELGYQPDPILAALCHYRHARSSTPIGAELAWINGWPVPAKLRSFGEFELYWQGAGEAASRSGYRLEEFRLTECKTLQRLQAILRARNIRGILIPPHGEVDVGWSDFSWDDFCLVRFGHSVFHPRAHLVTSDQLTNGMLAFENIWRQGYRRPAFVSVRERAGIGARFYAGFLLGHLKVKAGAQVPPLFFEPGLEPQKRQRQLAAWLKKNRPDALLTDLPEMRQWLASAGRPVPAVLGLAVTSVLDGKASAGIDQNSREIGRAAVQLLISLINHNERGIPSICRELLIEGHWVAGDTLPPKVPGGVPPAAA